MIFEILKEQKQKVFISIDEMPIFCILISSYLLLSQLIIIKQGKQNDFLFLSLKYAEWISKQKR